MHPARGKKWMDANGRFADYRKKFTHNYPPGTDKSYKE
jgi:hypothetical protein